ncbi:MAG: hypothetical protein M3M85_02845 [bacterium]|nr:hypothetical protein [bacterium]
MITRHFIKVLATFTVMIALGLAGVYLVNQYGQESPTTASVPGADCTGENC